MKKLILLLVVLGFLKVEVKAQAVEWVRTISGVGSLTYVNDSLIYLVDSKDRDGYGVITYPKSVSIINKHGEFVKSKLINYSSNISYNQLNLQQKFIISDNRILYSRDGLIIDNDLNIVTSDGLNQNYFTISNIYRDFSKIEIGFSNYMNTFQFSYFTNNNVKSRQNILYRDQCFYNNDCVFGNPFFDRNKTLFFSRCSYFKNPSGNCSNIPTNYNAVNTVGSNIITYANQYEAAIQSVISYDTNNNIRFLPFYNDKFNDSPVPEYFQEDSKGNILVLSYFGALGKYRKSPWDSLWTRKLGGDVGHNGVLQIDKLDRVYATFQFSNGDKLSVFDSLGNVLSSKLFPSVKIWDIQTDDKKSIYVASGHYNYNSQNLIGYLDCYTITGNYITKLYTGTLPSTPKLTQSGLVLKSNFPRGVTWYRNDSLLTSENDTFTLALRDGKYTFKAFCKQDTLNFKGISYPNGSLKTISISGATYQWYLNDVPIPNAITNTYSPTSVGKYTVKINFDKNQALFSSGRVSSTNAYQAVYSLNLVQLSVENDDSQTTSGYFSLYPNPATQTLTIKTAGFAQVPQAQILNALGQEVTSLSLSSELSSLDVSSFPKGIFSIKVGSQVQKLVVE